MYVSCLVGTHVFIGNRPSHIVRCLANPYTGKAGGGGSERHAASQAVINRRGVVPRVQREATGAGYKVHSMDVLRSLKLSVIAALALSALL